MVLRTTMKAATATATATSNTNSSSSNNQTLHNSNINNSNQLNNSHNQQQQHSSNVNVNKFQSCAPAQDDEQVMLVPAELVQRLQNSCWPQESPTQQQHTLKLVTCICATCCCKHENAAGAVTMTKRTTSISASSSSSGINANTYIRPQTLNVQNQRETPNEQTQLFFGEVLNAWRAKARCNVVSAERTQELFHELSFHPSCKQISEMLQTVKMLARKGSRQSNGLTFGEFCVLAADLRRFRTSTFPSLINDKATLLGSLQNDTNAAEQLAATSTVALPNCSLTSATEDAVELRGAKPLPVTISSSSSSSSTGKSESVKKTSTDASPPVEVFLGGSCNPTTWRADVAIPTLKELGISFYNPQVSDWTPDLIELEHRAKEKARVLFFVMDSETRASAGAIEAAHIAGQNCKQLVLVLHPYKPNQAILKEQISQQEFMDLSRNQQMLYELVTRRGLPVLDNIPSGLQRTKEILAGIRDPPSNIATILVVVRGAFDRVSPSNDLISVKQCRRALSYLGYGQSLLQLDNLNKIIVSQRESLCALHRHSDGSQCNSQRSSSMHNSACAEAAAGNSSSTSTQNIDFDFFCVISAYLSVLQQEIQESGCISPIKGTNLPPPPVYLTNLQGDESFSISYYSKNISRTSSNASVPNSNEERQVLNDVFDMLGRSRDSGTSSPQPVLVEPLKSRSGASIAKQKTTQILVNVESIETTEIITKQKTNSAPSTNITTTTPAPAASTPTASKSTQQQAAAAAANGSIDCNATTTEEESDSNDSVFSSSSSINSMNYNQSDWSPYSALDVRDVYLGGSCFLRTKWRQELAMPLLKSRGISFHLPALHESIMSAGSNYDDITTTTLTTTLSASGSGSSTQERTFNRTRRKCRSGTAAAEHEEEFNNAAAAAMANEESVYSWALPAVRANLYNPVLLDSSRVLLFVITNETRSLAPMTLAAHCIGLIYNVVLAVQMLPEDCVISNEKLTPAAIKDYNRGRSYLIDLAKRQGVPVFDDINAALQCTIEKVKAINARSNRFD